MSTFRPSAVLVCLSLLGSASALNADTIVLNPAADTYVSLISAPDVTTNFGNVETMLVAGGGAATALMSFDLSTIPAGATITGASLELYVIDQTNQGYFKLYRITNPWSESEATYNERLSGTTWTSAGGDYDETVRYGDVQVLSSDPGGYKTFSNAALLGLVQGWHSGAVVNDGIALRQELGLDNRRVSLGSSESANAPRLTIAYEPIPEPASLALLATGALSLLCRRR